jgi:uncharacterized membrane protein
MQCNATVAFSIANNDVPPVIFGVIALFAICFLVFEVRHYRLFQVSEKWVCNYMCNARVRVFVFAICFLVFEVRHCRLFHHVQVKLISAFLLQQCVKSLLSIITLPAFFPFLASPYQIAQWRVRLLERGFFGASLGAVAAASG